MMLKKTELVTAGALDAEYYLSDYFCPKCGNQTMYYLGSQAVAYACIRCHAQWQIRTNERPNCFDDILFEKVALEEAEYDEYQ